MIVVTSCRLLHIVSKLWPYCTRYCIILLNQQQHNYSIKETKSINNILSFFCVNESGNRNSATAKPSHQPVQISYLRTEKYCFCRWKTFINFSSVFWKTQQLTTAFQIFDFFLVFLRYFKYSSNLLIFFTPFFRKSQNCHPTQQKFERLQKSFHIFCSLRSLDVSF